MTEDRAPGPEHRREKRKTTLKLGRIIYNRATCTVECRVADLSDHGALLVFGGIVDLPANFDLEVRGAPPRPCIVRWRKGAKVGVEFQSTPGGPAEPQGPIKTG